jgi:hypothetical protein
MAKTTALEERLEAITRDFLAKIVETIRNASFAEVAGYAPAPHGQERERGQVRATERAQRPVTRVVATPQKDRDGAGEGARRPRQTADKRAEISERLLDLLKRATEPLGVRAIASELSVPPDLVAAPLRDLRDAGRIAKHGDKRNTTYSLA